MFDKRKLKEFVNFLNKKQWSVYGTCQREGRLEVDLLERADDLKLAEGVPFYSFKRFFVPEQETLFEYEETEFKSPPAPLYEREGNGRIALLGMNLLDLKSVLLYDQVFEKDPYYQARRQNILIIGHGLVPPANQNIFREALEEDILEHLSFDIFFGLSGGQEEDEEFGVFTGSSLGQRVLTEFGYNEFINIQFAGPVKEGRLDERMLKIQDKLKNHHNQKIWDKLGARCIECGKCTIACPTCFCFRIDDQAALEGSKGVRQRCWDACYYQEFSEVAGGPPRVDERGTRVEAGHKFLNDTAARIHFWYYHKFARLPDEFNFMGCVGCRRCAAVCPVGIDIEEVLKSIEES